MMVFQKLTNAAGVPVESLEPAWGEFGTDTQPVTQRCTPSWETSSEFLTAISSEKKRFHARDEAGFGQWACGTRKNLYYK